MRNSEEREAKDKRKSCTNGRNTEGKEKVVKEGKVNEGKGGEGERMMEKLG